MARTYNKSINAKETKPAAEPKAAPVAKRTIASAKADAPEKQAASVIAAPDEAVMQKIVYQPSAQILTREVGPNESFGVGDSMPIYYL